MKPRRTFIFFASTAALLFLLALIFPSEGINVSPSIHLKFMNLADVSSTRADKDEEVLRLLAASSVSSDPEADFEPAPVEPAPVEPPAPIVQPVIAANVDSLKQAIYPISFAKGQSDLLEPFFSRLDGLLNGSVPQTRIMHFGDSQIENDRMTSLIRFRLQKQFGGSGAGLVQAIPLYGGSMSFRQEKEGDWLRYTYFGKRDSTIQHNVYGIMGAFTSVPSPTGGDWPKLRYTFNTSRRTGTFDRVRVFMHSYVSDAAMYFEVNDTITDTIRNIPDGFSVAEYRHHCQVSKLSLAMELPQGGRIYGLSFESSNGVQVDNIAMRGGSGLIFSKMNREQQLRMLECLSPGLIILQYGGNVVPYINPARYQRSFRRELEFLKELCPGVPVIVIGPSDMSRKEKGKFESYPGVESVRNALKSASLQTGFAFWDLYEAMGGHNTMPSFVHADPPLASRDYVHFTPLGANLMAEMFYNALMFEYERFHSVEQ